VCEEACGVSHLAVHNSPQNALADGPGARQYPHAQLTSHSFVRVYVCVYVCVCVVYALKYLNDKQVSWRGTRRSGVVTDRCDCANSQSTKYRIGSLPETVGRIAWSQGFYPSNGILRKENMTRNNIFKKLP